MLLAGVVAAMTLAQQNISAITFSRNQLIATNLAQEGIELVRNKRESSYLSCYHDPLCDDDADPFNEFDANVANINGLAGPGPGTPCDDTVVVGGENKLLGCRVVDLTLVAMAFAPCDDPEGSGDCMLLKKDNDGLYNYIDGQNTIFDRRIVMTKKQHRSTSPGGVSLDDWEVRSIVTWEQKFLLDQGGTTEKRRVEVWAVLTPSMPF